MAWFWTDELARVLIAEDGPGDVVPQDWLRRPVAVAAPDGTDPAEVGRSLLGISPASEAVGAA